MASVGVRKRVSRRTGRVTYQVWWLLDDGSQGAETVSSKDEARDLVARKRLGVTRGAWQGLQRGRLPFSWWAEQWWEVWAADPDRSPTTLAITESRLRLYVRPWFGEKPIKRIGPADIRRWQAHLAASTGHATLIQCRSLVLRILQFAVDEGAIDSNPVRKVPSPRRRADPEQVLDSVKRRALTPEEAGRLLAQFPLFWWDHVLCLLGTGLRFGELAGLRRRRVHLDRRLPLLQVVDTRYQAGRFGSGFKPRPKSDAGIREIPLAPLVVGAIRRQLPPGSDPSALVFTGPGGGPGRPGGAGVPKGARTVLSRHNFHRTYQAALAKLADPTGELRPTAARVLKTLRAGGPQTTDQLTTALANHGRAIRPATVQVALGELMAAELVADADGDGQKRWAALPRARNPLLEAVDLHGAHDFRHTFATWLEDAGIPARVIDELMGHSGGRRDRSSAGSPMGRVYRETTPTMLARVTVALDERISQAMAVAAKRLRDAGGPRDALAG
jgi:integrase